MPQNLVSTSFTQAELDAIDAALAALENKFARLVELSADDRRSILKMGAKSEAFCRQTLILLDQNRQMLPPSFELEEAQRDLAALDQLRPRLSRLRQLVAKADDTETAIGSDLMNAAFDGYAIAKVVGKGASLEALRSAMSARYSHKRKPLAGEAS